MANTYLTRTPSSAGNRKTFTFSFWVKRNKLGVDNTIYNVRPDSNGANRINFHSGDSFRISIEPISKFIFTTRLFRDVSAWYHIVIAFDTTQGTAANRIKLYVNGVQETSLVKGDGGAATYPDQNADLDINTTNVINIGRDLETNSDFIDLCISHFHFCDGTALAPTVFGSTDSTTGEWKINTSPSFTPGTNGFTILKDGNTITDQSANSNNFSLGGGTLTKTLDCPSNIMATFNPLYPHNSTFTYGNTKCMSGSSGEFGSVTTLPMTGTGKYYAEFKWTNGSYPILGVCDDIGLGLKTNVNMTFGKTGTTGSIGFKSNGSWRVNNSDTSIAGSFALNDIIGSAIDKSTNKIYFSKNGVWSNGSGGWGSSTFNAATGAIDVSSILTGDMWFWGVGTDTGTANQIWEMNAGNGYYGITAVTTNSGNGYAGAEGASKFSYQPPTNYHALNTKGMNQ